MKKALRKIWNIYKQGCFVPIVITLVLIQLPSLIMMPIWFGQSLLSSTTPEWITIFSIVIPWMLGITSVVIIFIASIHQLKKHMYVKGVINIIFVATWLIFALPIFIFFLNPPGMWAVN